MTNETYYEVPIDPMDMSLAAGRMRAMMEKTAGYQLNEEITTYLNTFVKKLMNYSNIKELEEANEILTDFMNKFAVTFLLLGHEIGQIKIEAFFMTGMPSASPFDN